MGYTKKDDLTEEMEEDFSSKSWSTKKIDMYGYIKEMDGFMIQLFMTQGCPMP